MEFTQFSTKKIHDHYSGSYSHITDHCIDHDINNKIKTKNQRNQFDERILASARSRVFRSEQLGGGRNSEDEERISIKDVILSMLNVKC